jgi:ATP-dependent DNA helicase RecG
MLDRLIAEATSCDFKQALETRKPKSWLKSVSAFANGVGGVLIFGVSDDKRVVGLTISRLIKERITPFPNFVLSPEAEDGKDILILTVFTGRTPPYYYKADGVMEAYIRIGNESVIAPDYALNQLLLQGMNRSYDSLVSPYNFKDYSFSKLRERYRVWTGNSMEEKLFDSFEIRDPSGKLTNAGALLADDSPIRHSRLFCTRWNGLDKSGGQIDALDSAEYSGSLIILLNEGISFIKRNMKTMWKKASDSRIEMPEYCERSFFESIVNALIHRDYLVFGSEIHIDMYDDRLTIYSPGGMPDGTVIQNRDISNVSSIRRNPILADIFGRLGYMERQGSGLNKICGAYENASNFRSGMEPTFFSDRTQFTVTLPNLNYTQAPDEAIDSSEKQAFDPQKAGVCSEKQAFETPKTGVCSEKQAFETSKAGVCSEKQAFEQKVSNLNLTQVTRDKILLLFENFGFEQIFSRADISVILGITVSPAGALISKMKLAELIEAVSGYGKGKYRFIKQ